MECKNAKQLAVIKQIDISQLNEQQRKDTLKEAKILEVLSRHPNIVTFKEVYKTKQGRLCIVMEYIDGGDLNQKSAEKATEREIFSEDQVLNWFTQVCLALKHCHDRKIIHRDLKTRNIFITKKGICKLGDFGVARVLSNTQS